MTNDEELKYLEMLDAMAEAVHVIDSDFRILFQNRVVRQWNDGLGLGGDPIGRSLFDAYPFLRSASGTSTGRSSRAGGSWSRRRPR